MTEVSSGSLWNKFLDSTQVFKPNKEVLENWHRGRERYAVWMIRINEPLIERRIQIVNQTLSPYINIHPVTKPHITVFALGFPSTEILYNDDFDMAIIKQQVDLLRELQLKPISLKVGSANSLLTGPVLEIHDLSNQLTKIRQVLDQTKNEIRFSSFVPHITTGHYLEAKSPENFAKGFDKLRSFEPITLKLTELELINFSARAYSDDIAICPEDYETMAIIKF